MLRVGVLLAGCGAHDGSDIHEVVLLALALERALARPVYFAPAGTQAEVVDHTSGAVDDTAPPRDMLVESARLARGRVEPFAPETVSDLAALVVPGGLGVPRNFLTGVLVAGRSPALAPAVETPLAALRTRGVPLAAIGLGSVVLEALGEDLGVDPLAAPADRAVSDAARRLLWTPGFLAARGTAEASRGIDDLVRGLLDLLSRTEAPR